MNFFLNQDVNFFESIKKYLDACEAATWKQYPITCIMHLLADQTTSTGHAAAWERLEKKTKKRH